ncbi:acetyl-coenzyme A transporter 1 [Culicoides brevitarsis]|uniref:acetyl-coenzyme A transporter 1 n=1 Tax=Culicoides brevitarsis TaxID=469753 RepID=UPI00307C5DF5
MSKRRKNYEKEELLIHSNSDDHHESSNLRGDWLNIICLFVLYLLQGIPIGLAAAIPMLLQNRGTSYKQQAEFSFAHWPFSLKLLWAPIVDSLYITTFGRRKSWLIPTQYLIGLSMLLLSYHVNQWLGGEDGKEPNVTVLTVLFFAINFLGATQDIAVDGWALSMLKPENVGHASTCNSVGQTAGYFLGYVVFIALESTTFCNTYLRSVPSNEGIVTLSGFLFFWGIIFLITTTLVAFLKHEKHPSEDQSSDHQELNIRESYMLLWKIIKLRPVQILAVILLTVKIAFAAFDAVTSLKLIDAGVPKTKLAILVIPLVPLQIILPLVISKYTTGKKPLNIYIAAYPYRLCMTIVGVAVLWLARHIIVENRVPTYYYILLLVNYGLYQITLYSMFVAAMAFFAKISDPIVGGTYMTLLNTLCNLGGNWPSTLMLFMTDVLSFYQCNKNGPTSNSCSSSQEKDECKSLGGFCEITIDGYYVECVLCLLFGIAWYRWGKSKVNELQSLPLNAWRVVKQNNSKKLHSR